jgi:hypothetical protein
MNTGFPSPAIEGAPIDMAVNLPFQTQLTISQLVIALIVTVAVAMRSSRETRGVNLFLLIAGGCSILCEAYADAMLLIWHPTPGQWNAYHAFGHYVPVWVALVFYWSFGGQAVWILHDLRVGVSKAKLWKLYWFFAFTDLLFELPPLWMNVYVYYGSQPLTWPPILALPMYLPFGNAMVPVAAAVAALMAERHLNAGKQPWLILPVALTAMFCAITMYGWAVGETLNSDAPMWLIQAGGLLSIAISLLFMKIVANAFGKDVP